MKILLFAFFFFILLASSYAIDSALLEEVDSSETSDMDSSGPVALEVSVNSDEFYKGETIEVSGNSSGDVWISASNEGREVFSESASSVDGDFSFSYPISFLDPSGEWEIVFDDGNSTTTKTVSVLQTRESAFLAMNFLSPTPTTFRRTENINITLRITDAGQPLGEAIVYFWGVDGKKISIPHVGEGIYSYAYRIPEYAKTGFWELKVVSYYRKVREDFGGEETINLSTDTAQLETKLIEPVGKEFSLLSPLRLKFAFIYPDGGKLLDGNASVTLLQREIVEEIILQPTGDGYFEAVIPTEALGDTPLSLTVKVSDAFGNTAERLMRFEPRDSLVYFLRKNALVFIVPLLFLLVVVSLWYRAIKFHSRKKRLLEEKKKLLFLKKKNQQEYLVDRSISREVFDERNAKFEMKLREIKSKLSELSGGKKKD